jgi:hypothetical protein
MSILEPAVLAGLAGLFTALSSLIWALRRKP